MAQATINLYTRIPAELDAKLVEHLKNSGESKTEVVRKALQEYLEKPNNSHSAAAE